MSGHAALLDFLKKNGQYPKFRTITSGVNEPICTVGGKEYLLFCANNYLSSTENEDVKEGAKKAIDDYGVGPGGSRVISGNVDIIEKLEALIADVTGTEDCVTFPTGYMVNSTIFKALMDPFMAGLPVKKGESIIFSDEFNHGSIVDGVRLTSAKTVIFKHDDLEDLERKLGAPDLPSQKMIVTEGVFSLEGKILDLPAYVALAKKYKALLFIDDAHGFGVLGKEGGGIARHFELNRETDLYMGSLDKATGGTGGFVCGNKKMIEYLRIAMRSSLLSSALPTMMAGAMIASIERIRNAVKLREELFEKAEYMKKSLTVRGFRVLGPDIYPSVPLFMGDETIGMRFAEELWNEGVYCALVRWPAVPEKTARFRVIVMSRHSKEQIDRFVVACEKIGKKLGII